MTDKQIIIDGVDVSGCEHYEDHTLYDCNETCEINGGIVCTKCKDNPNCYYKQLKHKEQECQELMDNYVKLDNQRVREYNELVDKYKSKKQECERLKNGSGFWGRTTSRLQDKNNQLKQTLAEIKEMCSSVKDVENVNSLYDAKQSGMYLQARKILQKISECEEQ